MTINKRFVYTKDWFDAGIIFVHHLLDNNGNYLTFETFKQLFRNVIFFGHIEVSLVLLQDVNIRPKKN